MAHITVLTSEAVSALKLRADSVVVDCTLGEGGHAREVLSQLGSTGRYIGVDADPTAIESNKQLQVSSEAKIDLINDNFRNINTILESLNLNEVDAILADLGWRLEQFNGESGLPRGFSFQSDEPLHMTYGQPGNYPFTAHEIINDWAEEDIANVIYGYGEERFARRIAKNIVHKRTEKVIATAHELAEIVAEVVPRGRGRRIHPATKTFQALRIAVNDEFDALSELIEDGFTRLSSGGRMSIITFHSLEDRIVKQSFKALARDQRAVLVNKKPLEPSEEEQKNNPRSRSAKLRSIEKI